MKKKFDLYALQSYLSGITVVLFWAPMITAIFGWYDLSTALFVAFFVFFGFSIINGAYLYSKDRKNHSKTARFFQWFAVATGLFMIAIAMALLELEPFIVLLFSIPVMRLLSSRSITDILKDKPGSKHPWLDHLSDWLFIISAAIFILMFFGFFTEIAISLMLITLGASLIFDQIHYGINEYEWPTASGMIFVAAGVFLLPGIVILFWG